MTTRQQQRLGTSGDALAGALTGTWRIDPAHTAVTFSVRHLMSKVRGRFDEVEGTIVVGSSLGTSSATVSIATASVDTGVPVRDEDLRSERFFHAVGHPTMRFASTGVSVQDDRMTLVGDLTIRGVTRQVVIEGEYLGCDETGLQGEPRIGFAGRTTVRRSDFHVGDTASSGGKVVIGDAVTVELDVQAYRAEEAS